MDPRSTKKREEARIGFVRPKENGEENSAANGREKREEGRAKGNGASSARRVVPASFPVLIGCWLVAGARHSPETCVGPGQGPACSLQPSSLSLPLSRRERGIAGRTTGFTMPPVAQRRIKTIRDLERGVTSKPQMRYTFHITFLKRQYRNVVTKPLNKTN